MTRESVKRAVKIVVWCLALSWMLTLVGTTACRHWSDRNRSRSTQNFLKIFEHKAAEFHAVKGRWPADLSELTTYIGVPGLSNDSWGGPFLYTAPSGLAAGTIFAYGKDRLPGGTGADGDHYVTFGGPSK